MKCVVHTSTFRYPLLALTSADIDFDNKLIDINKTYQRLQGKDVITTPKTRKSKRKVPIPDFLCDELREFIPTRYMITPDERLFPITKSYLSHEMIRGCKNTGVKGFGFMTSATRTPAYLLIRAVTH